MRYFQIRNATRDVMLATRAGAATDSRERRTGLLKHTSLAEGEGMWIAPCEGIHTFRMKFPIDVLFLDKRKRIVKARANVAPWRMSMCLTANSVLELPAGTIARTGAARGDQLDFVEFRGQVT